MAHTACPKCGKRRSWKIRRDKRKCKSSNREFAPQRWPIAGFRMTEENWSHAASAFLATRTVRALAEALGVGVRQAHEVAETFRSTMASERPPPFRGPLEMDETYIGGQRKNKRLHIRRIRGKTGHGTDTLPIFGAFDRDSGRVFVAVEPKKLDIGFVIASLKNIAAPGAEVYTDGFKMYRGLARHGFAHSYVDHDRGEYVRGAVHTNNIEGFWGILKRTMGTIGGMRRDRLHLFAAEIAWRFNHRKEAREEKERALLRLVLRG